MTAGAPRTVSPPPDELIKLGKEMVEWVSQNQKTILHLSQWYSIHKCFTEKQWETFIDRKEFMPYYEQALKIVGLKYLDKNSNVRDGISQRWQRVYFKDLRKQEDSDAKYNSDLKKSENESESSVSQALKQFLNKEHTQQ